MKSTCFILLLSGCLFAHGQSLGVFAGKNLLPADYIAIQYFHPSNYPLQLSAQFFAESSKRNSLRYHAYGVSISLNYLSAQESVNPSSLSYRLGLGTTLQFAQEPWLFAGGKNLPASAFGFTGEAAGEWAISSAFSLSLFVQQKYLFRHPLGNRQFVFGIGITYHLNNE